MYNFDDIYYNVGKRISKIQREILSPIDILHGQ